MTSSHLKMYRYYVVYDDQARFLLAPDSESAAWQAAELSGGSDQLVNVMLDPYG